MKNVCLKIYSYESQKHHGILLYEWLLEFAKKNGIKGGSAFRAIAGYGHSGEMHEEHFFELAANVPIKNSFIMKREQADNFLKALKDEKIDLFYEISEVEYGRVKDKE